MRFNQEPGIRKEVAVAVGSRNRAKRQESRARNQERSGSSSWQLAVERESRAKV